MDKDEAAGLPADGSERDEFAGAPVLSDEMRAKLEEKFEELHARMHEPGFDPAMYVTKLVGAKFLQAATAHLAGLRLARMRQAAKAKGFDVGV